MRLTLLALLLCPVSLFAASTRGIAVEPVPPKKPTKVEASRGRVDAMKAATSGLLVEGSAPKGFSRPDGDSALKKFQAGAAKVYQHGGAGALQKMGAQIQTRLKKQYGSGSQFEISKPLTGANGRTIAPFFQQLQQKGGQRRFVSGSVTVAGSENP